MQRRRNRLTMTVKPSLYTQKLLTGGLRRWEFSSSLWAQFNVFSVLVFFPSFHMCGSGLVSDAAYHFGRLIGGPSGILPQLL